LINFIKFMDVNFTFHDEVRLHEEDINTDKITSIKCYFLFLHLTVDTTSFKSL
jgi:hypothetical protein